MNMDNKEIKGICSSLKAISEASDYTKDAIKSINIESLNIINDYYKRFDMSNLIGLNSITSAFVDTYRNICDSGIISNLPLNLTDYAESLSKVFINSQNICTSFTETITNSFINNDYNSFINSINNTLSNDFIDSLDIAFLKKSDLIISSDDVLDISNNLKKTIKDLNKYSADRLVKAKGIDYETATNTFIDSKDSVIKATSKEMNVICSSMYLFDEYEEDLFTEVELMNFVSFLDNIQTFASQNHTGQKIFRFIEHLDRMTSFDKKVYYHARTIEEGNRPYTYSEMLCAPTGIMNPGRYNHPGQSFYYFTDEVCGCHREMGMHSDGKRIQIAKIKPIKNITMIDLSGSIKHANTLLKHIRFPKGNEQIPKAYLLPCYISDCCRKLKIEGIKFRGSDKYSNYVCWDSGYFDFVSMI